MNKNLLTKGLLAALLLASPMVGAESKYPAADFQPGVVYKDADLIAKHNAPIQAIAPAPVATSQATEESSPEQPAAATQPEASSMQNFPIVLVVLALAGLVYWSTRQSKPKDAASAPSAAAPVVLNGSAGETGVAKYLKAITPAVVAETGVAKYLKSLPEKVAAAPETGVAKYLKGLPEKAPAAPETGVAKYLKNIPEKAAAPETGVAKYLKNRDNSAA